MVRLLVVFGLKYVVTFYTASLQTNSIQELTISHVVSITEKQKA